MPTLLGTPVVFTLTTQDPAAQNITVPSGCDLMVVSWGGYNASGFLPTTLTLAGNALSTAIQQTSNIGGNGQGGGGCAYYVSPPSGTQSLDWAWSQSPTVGAPVIVTFWGDVDTASPIRDSDLTTWSGGPTTGSRTLDSEASDTVLLHVFGTASVNSTPASSGQTAVSGASGTAGGLTGAAATEDTPGGTSTTVTATATNGLLVAISIRTAAPSATVEVDSTAAAQASAIDVEAKPEATVASSSAAQVSAVSVSAKPTGTVASEAAPQASAIVAGTGNLVAIGSAAAAQASELDGAASAGVGVASASSGLVSAIAAVVRVVAEIAGAQAPQRSTIRVREPGAGGGGVTKVLQHGGRFGVVARAIIRWGRERLGGDHHAAP